ncbi:Flp pilus assembly protein TadG [Nocardioides sp. BE266]|uniref:TadE/TadG family type IV pilus assembly protein n=1 Tax=Nocardioides sp. BE266 TaxID=2817725 RepID=UPI00285AD331|nr:TadE/TadG family type IV pilus assembly protein [Nocardioides sp. BE266]MDR7254164.1 Flp pilus assembly protein TadG [Nocardioides sp. BE266]
MSPALSSQFTDDAILQDWHRRDDRGSVAIEAVVGLPAFALFVALIVMGGRIEVTRQAIEAAAYDGARTASLERTRTDAAEAARSRVATSLAGLPCSTSSIVVDAAGYDAPLGTTVLVGVTITCRVGLADLSLPGVPGHRVITETAYSPVDAYRERR